MKAKGPSLRSFQQRFPTEDSCLDHLFQVRYGTDFTCPKCSKPAKYTRVAGRRSYQCQWCANQVYPTAGTPFDRTRTSLRDWFVVMFQFCTSRHGVAAMEVHRQLGVTYKTAWRMCHEIRKYMAQVDGDAPIGGGGAMVEVDETLVGGKIEGKGPGRQLANKTVVLGMVERGGDIVTKVVADQKRDTLIPAVMDTVQFGSMVYTDALHSYKVLNQHGYMHESVNHNVGQYVSKTGAHTQTIESFWSRFKLSVSGTHVHVSRKHLSKYLGEFEYRWNMRQQPHLMVDRLLKAFSR
jgi:transposase